MIDVEEIDTNKVAHLFPEITLRDFTRPKRKVEILIGSDCCDILPNKAGLLKLIKNQFCYYLRESHPSLGLQQSANRIVMKIYLANGKSSRLVLKTFKHYLHLLFFWSWQFGN